MPRWWPHESKFIVLGGPQPFHAVQLINELSLYHCIFHVPPDILAISSSSLGPPESSLAACSVYQSIVSPSSPPAREPIHPTLLSRTLCDPQTRTRLFLAACFFPFYGITYEDKKQREHYLVEASIRQGLRLGTQNHYLDGIPALYCAASELVQGLSLNQDRFKMPSERVAIGTRGSAVRDGRT